MRPWFRKTNRRRHKSGGPSREIMRKLLCQGGIPTSYVGVPSPLHDQFRGLGRQDHIPNAHNASVRAVEEPCDRGLVVFALLDDEFTTEIHFDIILLCIGEFIDFGNNSVADPEGEVPVFSRSACQSDARGHGTRYCAIFERNSWLDELRQAVVEAVYGYAWDNRRTRRDGHTR